MKTLFFCCLTLILCSIALAVEPVIVNLGGPRKATATILDAEDKFEIEISLIPVRCFDAGMNRRLSQDKARAYASEALLRHIGGEKQQRATIKSAEVVKAGIEGKRYVLVIRVPHKNVQITKADDPSLASQKPDKTVLVPLLKVKDDFQETFEAVVKSLNDDLPMFTGKLTEFYLAIYDAETLGVNRLASLGKEIVSDKLLLTIEKEELLEAISTQEKLFLERLQKLVQKAESNVDGAE